MKKSYEEDIQKEFFINLAKQFKENNVQIEEDDLIRLKNYIRVPTEGNRAAFVNILEKYIFKYNLKSDDFKVSQYLLVERIIEFQKNSSTFISEYVC